MANAIVTLFPDGRRVEVRAPYNAPFNVALKRGGFRWDKTGASPCYALDVPQGADHAYIRNAIAKCFDTHLDRTTVTWRGWDGVFRGAPLTPSQPAAPETKPSADETPVSIPVAAVVTATLAACRALLAALPVSLAQTVVRILHREVNDLACGARNAEAPAAVADKAAVDALIDACTDEGERRLRNALEEAGDAPPPPPPPPAADTAPPARVRSRLPRTAPPPPVDPNSVDW